MTGSFPAIIASPPLAAAPHDGAIFILPDTPRMERKNARLGMALDPGPQVNLSLRPTAAPPQPLYLVLVTQLLYFTPHVPGDRQGVLIVYLG